MPPKRTKKEIEKVVVEEEVEVEVEEVEVEKVEVEEGVEKKEVKKVNVEQLQKVLDEVLTTLDEEIQRIRDEKGKGIKNLKKARKNVNLVLNKLPKLVKSKNTRKKNPNAKSGLQKKVLITDELANFLKKPKGTLLSRNEVTKAISVYVNLRENDEKAAEWAYLNEGGKRNLKVKGEGIKPDAALSKLLRYDQYVKDVKAGKITEKNKKVGEKVVIEDTRLYHKVITRLIQRHFVKENEN